MYSGEVYVDGACRGNGQPGARGGVGVHFPDLPSQDRSRELGGDRQTNQRAGIQAATEAVRAGADLGYDAIVVKTDNKNVVNAHNDWMGKWRSNGWRNCRGKPVVNRDDFEELQNAIDDSGMAVRFEHTPAGCSRGNQIAEDLARYAYQDSGDESDSNEYESGDEEYLYDDQEQGYDIDQLQDLIDEIHLEENIENLPSDEVGCSEGESDAPYVEDIANDVNDAEEINNEADNGPDDQSVGGDDQSVGGGDHDYSGANSDYGGNASDYGDAASDYGGDYSGGDDYDYGYDEADNDYYGYDSD